MPSTQPLLTRHYVVRKARRRGWCCLCGQRIWPGTLIWDCQSAIRKAHAWCVVPMPRVEEEVLWSGSR